MAGRLVFVMSAGFAREYDAEVCCTIGGICLSARRLAGFVISLVLRSLWRHRLCGKPRGPVVFAVYRSFLGVFWLTAPLAWLYAVPYERFMDPVEATRADLATLGLVQSGA